MNNQELFDRTWANFLKLLVPLSQVVVFLLAFMAFIMFITPWITLPIMAIAAVTFVAYTKAKGDIEFEEQTKRVKERVIKAQKRKKVGKK